MTIRVTPQVSIRTAQLALMTMVLLGPAAATADAQPRRGRVAPDLAERLGAGDLAGTSVIVTAADARVDALAARHGLRIRKRLHTGAVLDVPAGALAAL